MSDVLNSVLNVPGIIRMTPEPLLRAGLSAASSALDSYTGGMLGGGGVSELMDKQLQVQAEMMVVNMESNLHRSEHEIKMAPVRNLRLG